MVGNLKRSGGETIRLGLFSTAEEANEVRKRESVKYNYHENSGRLRGQD
jgi:hypothetical protein